jgi:L-amino acid N-acyltransferase YncA
MLGIGVVAEPGAAASAVRYSGDLNVLSGEPHSSRTAVREDNTRAIALYESLGFVVEGLKRNGVRLDGRYGNLVCMALLFGT